MLRPWWAGARLHLLHPGALVWSSGAAGCLAVALLAGEDPGASFLPVYYLLCLALFGGVLGGEPTRSLRRWLVPGRWSPERLLAAAVVPRLALALAGLGISFGVLAAAGHGAWSESSGVARMIPPILAGAAWATLLSAFSRGWFNVVGVSVLHLTVFWQVAVVRPEPLAGPAAGLLFAAVCPPLSRSLLSPPHSTLLPLGVAGLLFALAWWRLRASEVPA